MSHISLRSLKDNDISKMAFWLNKDNIRKWYKDPEDWLFEIRGRTSEFSWIHHMIVEENGLPIGFCQYYDCYDANDMEDWYQVEVPNDTYSIDYLIGEEAYLNKGYGKLMIKSLTELIMSLEKARRIIVQPDRDNIGSNSVLFANGYIFDSATNYYVKYL